LVFFIYKRPQRTSHLLVGVEAHYNHGTTLHAPSGDEKAWVHKEQGCLTTDGEEFGQSKVDRTHQCHSTYFGR
jgi:hypothetical protein